MSEDNVKTLPSLEYVKPQTLDCLTAIVIPAHMRSTRLPGKPLLDETGQPLVCYAIDSAMESSRVTDVGFVTDHHELYQRVAKEYIGKLLPVESKRAAACGSHRVGHWLNHFDGWDTYGVVVNLQGDEPNLDPRDLDNLILACALSDDICTLVAQLTSECCGDPNSVKAYLRSTIIKDFSREMLVNYSLGTTRLHVGAYAVPRRWFQACFSDRLSPRAKSQSLEQLTWLDGGIKMRAVELKHTTNPISVNTPEQYRQFVAWHKRQTSS